MKQKYLLALSVLLLAPTAAYSRAGKPPVQACGIIGESLSAQAISSSAEEAEAIVRQLTTDVRRSEDQSDKPSKKRKGKDSCEYAKDGECDEPDDCRPGTDTTDCKDTENDETDEPEVGRSCCMFRGGRCGPFWDQDTLPIGDPCSCQYGNPNADGKVCAP